MKKETIPPINIPVSETNGDISLPWYMFFKKMSEKTGGAKVYVADTETGEPGTDAKVENIGTDEIARLKFTIPQGDIGPQGIQGIQGPQGEKGDIGPYITNCITEIPQDIKLELADGVVTIKAGSKIRIPKAGNVFEDYVFASDTIRTGGAGDSAFLVALFNVSNNKFSQMFVVAASKSCSGATDTLAGKTYHLWYDTTNNVIKYYGSDGVTNNYYAALPLAIVSGTGTITSIDQVFNGFGYIGSTVFVLPGVCALAPDGRNKDGTLRNIKLKTTNVSFYRTTNTSQAEVSLSLVMQNNQAEVSRYGGGFEVVESLPETGVAWRRYYVPSENYIYVFDDSATARKQYAVDMYAGTFSVQTSAPFNVTALNPNMAFRVVDYNDFKELDNSVVHKTGYEIIAGIKHFTGDIKYGSLTENDSFKDIEYRDANGIRLGTLRGQWTKDGSRRIEMFTSTADGSRSSGIAVYTTADGKEYHTAKTPDATSNTNHIATTAWVNNAAVLKTGNETISGIKSFRELRFRDDVPNSKDITTATETALTQTTLNTAGGIDGAGIIRYVHANGNREVRYRAGFSKRNSSGNVWPGIRVGVDTNDKVYYQIDESPVASSNGTNIATTAWANAKFLPLAGGTLSGTITRSGATLAKRNVDNSYLELFGGTTYLNGAFLRLDGKDSSLPGQFNISTGDGSKNIALVGKTDGTLLWNGVYVVTTKAKSLASNGYVKFNNGLIIQWGRTSGTGTTKTITFPTAFTSTNYVAHCLAMTTDAQSYYAIAFDDDSKTTTGCTFHGSGNATKVGWHWMAIGY